MNVVRWIAAVTVMLFVAATGSAADPAKIDAAIAKGAAYLKKAHAPAQGYTGGGHGTGSAALSGMAMLEAGVATTDAAIQNITQLVRAYALAETKTYNVALMIVFLDRLGDPADVPFIQFLGARLYAALNNDGGWSYNCGSAVSGTEEARLRAAFQQGTPRPKATDGKKGPDGFPLPTEPGGKGEDSVTRVHPAVVPYLNAARSNTQRGTGSDNSNTQFGMIGLWVAGRHGIPVEPAFVAIERRFVASQNRADFGWGYRENDKSSGSMTCAGLLALAFGQARKPALATTPDPKKPSDPNDSFLNPKGKEKEKDAGGAKGVHKAAIDGALRAIGLVLQIGATKGWGDFVGYGNEYYLLWSIERVAMAYGLDTIGNADWHDIGCNFLLPAQSPEGSWAGGQAYGADVDTSFAILFLSKSNFVRDLSRKIGGHKDPGTAELRGGGDNKPPLYAPRTEHKGGGQDSPMSGGTGSTTDVPSTPAPTTSGDALADGLIAAMGEDFASRLKHIRDAKGAEHTAALVRAIPKLDVARQKQAREALAERLTRMTAATLRTMLKDKDEELRRGACLACAMKEDRSHLPDLIERITDSSDLVVRAARASLKSMSGKDFGPPAGADESTKAKAAMDWKTWYETEGK